MRHDNVRRGAWRLGLAGLVTVLAATLLPAQAAAVEPKPGWGTVSAEDGVLKASCRNYPYSYSVTAPEDGYWDLSVTVIGPGGRDLWFGYLYEDANPASGTAMFRLCRSKVRPGRYKLRAIVSVQDGDDNIAGRLKTDIFHLRKRR